MAKIKRKKMVKHTPTPWFEGMDGYIKKDHYNICNSFLNVGDVPSLDEQLANSRLIVNAVNCHKELVDSANGLLTALEKIGLKKIDALVVKKVNSNYMPSLLVATVEQALSKADLEDID